MGENAKRHYRPYTKARQSMAPAPKTPPEGYIFVHQERPVEKGDKYWTGGDWVELPEKHIKLDRSKAKLIRYVGTVLEAFDTTQRYQIVWRYSLDADRPGAVKALIAHGYTDLLLHNPKGWDDAIVVDHHRKEWQYWSFGSTPFFTGETFPTTHNLSYWHKHAS